MCDSSTMAVMCGLQAVVPGGQQHKRSITGKAVLASRISRINSAVKRLRIWCGEGYDDGYQRRDKSQETRAVDLRALASCTWSVR